MLDAVEAWIDGIARRAGAPDPDQTVSAWADAHRWLDSKSAAEPGRWRTERTPYLRAIMDDLSPSSPVEKVVMMKGTQLGGTEAGNNWLGFVIDRAPGPMMCVSPTVELAKRVSRQRIEPLIEGSPALRHKVAPARSRDSGNTVLLKEFPGGVLILTGANSAVGLRSMPVRYLFLDEVDAYPGDLDGEGDPVQLAIKRTDTFARRKILMVSTPTITGLSRIEAEFQRTDQRRFFVPCPECGEHQVLRWSQVKWSDLNLPPERAVYVCEHCGSVLEDHRKAEMLAGGEWRPTAEGEPRTRGYALSSLYSPPGWFSWGRAAVEFVAAKSSPVRLKTWVNTVLGETFREADEAPDWKRLYDRRDDYPLGRVPRGGLVLTAGVDTQNDRLEVQVVAWGRGWRSWVVDYVVLNGDPGQPAVWLQLDRLLNRSWDHEAGGVLRIARLAIDTGGHNTQAVYGWCAMQDSALVMAVKGDDRSGAALGPPSYVELSQAGRKLRRGAQLWPVGVSALKAQLYGWLRLDPAVDGDEDPEGWCRFPRLHEEYFKQLTAERRVMKRTKSGGVRREWELTRDRNEALDTRIYATAAALAEGLQRWSELEWSEAEAMAGERATGASDAAPGHLRPGQVIRSSWLS